MLNYRIPSCHINLSPQKERRLQHRQNIPIPLESRLSNFAARSKKRSNRFACFVYDMLLSLLQDIRGAELGIIPDETPPNVGKRDCGGMPKRMGIHVSFIWREVVDF